jgi:hypothetical protein
MNLDLLAIGAALVAPALLVLGFVTVISMIVLGLSEAT